MKYTVILLFGLIGINSYTNAQCPQKECITRAIEQCYTQSPSIQPPRLLSPSPPTPNVQGEYEYDYEDPPCPPESEPAQANVEPPYNESPPPSPPSQPALMTQTFPLGSCKMNNLPSLPYLLSLESQNDTTLCFRISLVSNWIEECTRYNKLQPCQDMVSNNSKIVFSYRLDKQCGFDLAQSKLPGLFDWRVRSDESQVPAGSFMVYAPGTDKSHHTSLIKLYKWKGIVNNQNIESVEVEINKKDRLRRPNDDDLHNYIVCLKFNPSIVDVPFCIRDNNNLVKYSFYDPNKKLCTTGIVVVP